MRRILCFLQIIALLFAASGRGFAEGHQTPLDLTSVVNRAFRDDVAGDGKGGWSDQGPENSLVGLKAGLFDFGGIRFSIIDGSSNQGRAVLVLDGGNAKPVDVMTAMSAPANGGALYLLHTACQAGSVGEEIGMISVRFASEKVVTYPVKIRQDLADWWGATDQPNGTVAYREENKSAQVGVYISRFPLPEGEGRPVSVEFRKEGNPLWIILAATLSDVDLPLPQHKNWTAKADDEWRPYDLHDDNIDIEPGSALDFSTIFPSSGDAGKDGFLKINKKGEFVFEKAPDKPVKFFCDMPQMIFLPKMTPEKAERLADQVARSGHNIYRTQFLDYALMNGSNQDHVFNQKQLDAWDCLSSALKKRGVYLQLDLTTSWASFYALRDPWNQAAHDKRLRSRMYYDPSAREHWKKGVKQLLEHINPYTGVVLKDEPQVAIVQLRNEAGIDFLMGTRADSDPDIVVAFRAWLSKRYGNTDALRTAWSRKEGDATVSDLPRNTTIDTIKLPPRSSNKVSTQDLMRFYTEIERETYQWMANTVREIGVKVPLTEYNNGGSLQVALSRDVVDVSDNHAYHDLNSDDMRPGSGQDGNSSLSAGLSYYRYLAGTRHWGRPYLCTEWGHVFWNPYRYEAGLTVPAYASLQGWAMLTQFGTRDELKVGPIVNTVISFDPPLRAAEYMAALFFRRGDVETSTHQVEVKVNPSIPEKPLLLQNGLSSPITRLSLLTGLGIRVEGLSDAAPRAPYRPNMSVLPDGGVQIISGEMAQKFSESAPSANSHNMVAQLRAKGILNPSNITDPEKGIYQSDTGQILLNENARQITVTTSRSQGVALASAGMKAELPGFSVQNHGAPVTVFLGSLTPKPLVESNRLLLIAATDALNSGMTFNDEQRHKLIAPGSLPILLRVARLDGFIPHHKPGELKMWALGYSGRRMEEIPLQAKADGVSFSIDTGKLQNGPTPFFELDQK